LIKGDVANLAALLTRRISLGSDSAAALLSYLEFMGAISGVSNPHAAITLCAAAAKRGHGYAQYVLSWAHWEIGEWKDALRWMKSSAVDSKFLPAWVELGVMLAILGSNKREVRAGVTYVWVAHKLGHAAALLNICAIGLGGRLGLAWRLGCTLAFPFCLLRAVIFWKCHPFSERSLVTLKNPKVPFLEPRARS
jgi:TPR repeat protein